MKFTGERYIPYIDGWIALQHYHRYYFVVNQFDLKEKIILDIACGEGYGCNILAKTSKFVFGIDISVETIDEARKTYTNYNSEFLVGSTSSIPLDDHSVDVVVSFETIEHHDRHTEMMQEIKRVLKEDGLLIISSPDKGYYEKYLPGLNNEFHVKELYCNEFKLMIKEYFQYSEFFIQNNTLGSIIACENEHTRNSRPIHFEKNSGISQNIEPRFNVCIASDKDFSFVTSVSICTPSFNFDIFSVIDIQNNIIEEQRKTIESIYSSVIWRLREFFSLPYRKINKLLK